MNGKKLPRKRGAFYNAQSGRPGLFLVLHILQDIPRLAVEGLAYRGQGGKADGAHVVVLHLGEVHIGYAYLGGQVVKGDLLLHHQAVQAQYDTSHRLHQPVHVLLHPNALGKYLGNAEDDNADDQVVKAGAHIKSHYAEGEQQADQGEGQLKAHGAQEEEACQAEPFDILPAEGGLGLGVFDNIAHLAEGQKAHCRLRAAEEKVDHHAGDGAQAVYRVYRHVVQRDIHAK